MRHWFIIGFWLFLIALTITCGIMIGSVATQIANDQQEYYDNIDKQYQEMMK